MSGAGRAEAISMKYEGFSIREYVSKTRSTNVMKCWPFGDGTNEETVKDFLPPIVVEKFRWWSHEFDLLKSEKIRPLIRGESSKSVPPKPVKNSSGESTLIMRSIRPKRKKRSILEIFADEENDARNLKRVTSREVGLGLKRKMMKERKNKKKPKLKNESGAKSDKQNTALKLKKTIGSERVESPVRKEKSLKAKLHSSVATAKKPINKSRFSKGLLKGTSHHIVSSTNNKCQMNSLAEQQEKNRNPQISKSIGKGKKPLVVRGILKKYKEDILVKRSTLNGNPHEDDCQGSLSLAPKPGRHVRFSGKDDVISLFPLKQLGSTPSLEETKVFSASPLGAKNKRSDEMPLSSVNGAEVQLTCDRPQIGFRREHLPETSELLNHVANLPTTEGHQMFGKSYGVASNESTYGIDPRYLPPPLEHYGSNMSAIPSGSNAKKNQSMLTDHIGTSSSSYNIPSDGRAAIDCGTIPFDNSNLHSFPYGRYHHLTPKELMWSICSVPPDRQQREFTNGLFGLPLNSQGELIQMNSTGQTSFNQLMMPASTTTTATSSSTTATSLDMWKNEEIRRKLNHLSFIEKQKQPAPSFIGLSTSHFEDSMRENIHHHPKRDDGIIIPAHSIATTTTTPTIRLMGKEFTVSKLDKGSLEDERVWTDKEIIAEHRPPAANVTISDGNSVSSESAKHNVGFMPKTPITTTRTPLINGEFLSYRSSPTSLFSSSAIKREQLLSTCHDYSPLPTFTAHTRTTNSSFSMNQGQQRPPFLLEFPSMKKDDNNMNSEEVLHPSRFQTSVKKVNNLFDTGGMKHYNHHPYPNPYSFSRDNRQSMQPTIGVSYPQQRLPFQAPFKAFSGGSTPPPGGENRYGQDDRLMVEPGDRVRIRNRSMTTFEEKKWRKRPASWRWIAPSGKLPCKTPNYNLVIPKESNVTSSSSSSVVEIETFEQGGNTIVSSNNNNNNNQKKKKKKKMMMSSFEKEVGTGRAATTGPIKLSGGVKHVLKPGSNANHEDDICRPTLMNSTIISSSSAADEVSGPEKSAATPTIANEVAYRQ